MTREQHGGLFGGLCILCFIAIAGGLIWWFAEVFLPRIAWARMAADFLALPGGVKLAIAGLLSLVVIAGIGKMVEP